MNNQKILEKYTRVHDLWVNLTKFNQKMKRMTNGCWEWQGATHVQGYGMVSAIRAGDNKRIMTVSHRIAMRVKLNRPLGKNDDVQHLCGNPRCCNPEHLVLKLDMRQRQELEKIVKEYENTKLPV